MKAIFSLLFLLVAGWLVAQAPRLVVPNGNIRSVKSVAFSHDGNYILTDAILWNVSRRQIQSFDVQTGALSPDGKLLLTGSYDFAKLWDLNSGRETKSFSTHAGSVNSVTFSPDGKQALLGNSNNTAKLWDLNKRQIKTFTGHVDEVTSVAFSPDGQYALTGSLDKTAKLWGLSGALIRSFSGHTASVNSVAFSPDGKQILTGSGDKTAKLWDFSGRQIQSFSGHANIVTSVAFSPDGKQILTGSRDGTTKLWMLDGQEVRTFSGHCIFDSLLCAVLSVAFSPDARQILTCGIDGTAKLWDIKSGKELATLTAIDYTDWVVTTPSGLFDASPNAMKKAQYRVSEEDIYLEQLKNRYYEPGLLAKIMGSSDDGLRPVEDLKNLRLYPHINGVYIRGDSMRIELERRTGGIGKLALLVNDNIEIDTNVNPAFQTDLKVNLRRFANYFFPDSVNHLSLRTYNREGWLKGPLYRLDYRPIGNRLPDDPLHRRERQLDSINLYALVVGTSHFQNAQINLKYPDEDATAFADALRLAGKPLFGKNIEVQVLNTATEPWPRKTVIAKAMHDIAVKADPNDILLVYLSGHGMTYPTNSEKGRFYYLTTDIDSTKFDDPAVLAMHTIAQDTLQEWIRQVKARKRILILDACNSGKVIERLEATERGLNSDQLRALEQMKDRSGMFVLAGSAANKSSYEASRYGHGLLTYSLLNNMPIVAAANKHFIQIDQLFGKVREEVPRLAKDIGKVQDPELIGSETYAIGLLDENTRIDIPEEKPVFVRTVFIDSQKNKDLLHLSTAVNDYLERRASEKDPAIAYWAVDEFAGDHYYLGGQYQQNGETLSGKATLYREDKELTSFTFSGEKNALGRLVEEMVVKVFGYLNGHRD